MTNIVYISADGERNEVEAEHGKSVMETALQNQIPGIVGECGGNMQCSTCHVYVDENNDLTLPSLCEEEDEMLEGTATERTDHSRLGCQLKCTPETDGLVVHTPETQY